MRTILIGRFGLLAAALLSAACHTNDAGSNGTAGTGGSSGAGGSSLPQTGGAGGTGGSSVMGGAGGAVADGPTMNGAGGAVADGGRSDAHYYVSPTGAGTTCSSAAPCSITQAQMSVQAAAPTMKSDLVVELVDGVYRLEAPLVFTAADSGANGHTILWQAAADAHPVISGAKKITGWTMSDAAKNIWTAPAPATFATRQLFVDGKLAVRARQQINRNEMAFSDAGFTFSNAQLNFLNSIAHPERTDLHAVGSFTDRYSPVQSISNNMATMIQPAWKNNNWGYDTIKNSFRPADVWIENAYEFIDEAGEWYLDTTAGALYVKPLDNQNMASADVELPQLEALVVVAGTYEQPAHDLAFHGLTFSHSSWLGPNSTDGYSCQQTGAYIHGADYPAFEATRPKWWQMPAAVQVSAANHISFERDRFAAIGQAGIGIGNDDEAHFKGVGLGADTIDVTGCVFTQIASGAIVIGGIKENAHHPSDPRMLNQNMTISNNLVHDVGIDYRDAAGIFFTYTKKVVVAHNEIYNIPYSGINSGYGWGANDEGGSDEYQNRGLYNYQPRYTTPTVAENNRIEANYLHDGMQQMNDGGCHYHLSASPMTVVTRNYCKGPWPSASFGDYEDEGSRYVTITENIFSGWGTWGNANANPSNKTGDLTVTGNWVSGGTNWNGMNNMVTGNINLTGALPAEALAIADAAGLEPAYADLKMAP